MSTALGESDLLLGRLALHYKMLTSDQLTWALRKQQQQGSIQTLGDLLVGAELLSPAQLMQLQKVQSTMAQRQQAAAHAAAAVPSAAVAPSPIAASAALDPSTPISATAHATARAPLADSQAARCESASEVSLGHSSRGAASGGTDIETILRQAVDKGASDIHIHGGAPLRFRLNGTLVAQSQQPLAPQESRRLTRQLLNDAQQGTLEKTGQLDFAYSLPAVGRFRGNAYRQQRGTDVVLRAIAPHPPELADLGLPESLANLVEFHQGLVLITGPAGSGKSSTMAALLNIINEQRSDHIITVEEPIEYVHPSKACVVNQRQVGAHTESFARALRAALREDPDVIAIGELRDLETISLALTAAETGHFVLGTLHTNNAIRTINRLLGVFPPDQQAQIRTMLSESLRAVVSQRLLPRADGSGRVPALEILRVNKAVGNLIRENKTFQIRSVLQTGMAHGMCLLDTSLIELVRSGAVSRDEALRHAEDPKRFPAA